MRISIHALREEGDWDGNNFILTYFQFLSTPSARRATSNNAAMAYNSAISIHALREEGDSYILTFAGPLSDFYPRPPRGGRRLKHAHCHGFFVFLSTPSARRATPTRSVATLPK